MPTILDRGTDTSGRQILMTPLMAKWLEGVYSALSFTPTIVQGAFMARAGGGASESAGYHDGGGCIDFRIWDLTEDQQTRLVRVLRKHGAGAWRRDQAHGGMDPHIHIVCGWDKDLATGAQWQWQQYIAGRDGLASSGPDYEWRPTPLVTEPVLPEEFDMDDEKFRKLVNQALKEPDGPFATYRAQQRARDQRIKQAILGQLDQLVTEVSDDASRKQVQRVRSTLADVVAALDTDGDEA
ncbi:hypothetical protein [Nocardioides bruguierae]|uniref:hypothetical protein n=1 Tax=Nocardioides bruguierae TaxID=2945102 RepID=UPI00201FD3F9|nr:hypothetical protein [Nocardioides bruguierae]MCL8026299.1 hypothetical protein [Nocardioides bruguierae]